MTQLSLFNRAELASLRDRTKARGHSPQGEAFRREHQRRRDHGKAQRHAARIYRTFQQSCSDEVPSFAEATSFPAVQQGRGRSDIAC